MNSTMMLYPLLLTRILERADRLFPDVNIVSAQPDGFIHRYTYRDLHRRSRRLSAALQRAGIAKGDRVATLMWNEYQYLEAYFGVPAVGAVLHTLNLRLHPDELAYIINHAQDRFLIVDDVMLDVFEQIRPEVKFERVFVVEHGRGNAPPCFERYEGFLAEYGSELTYPVITDDDAAAMCYTSGTTGRPKDVVYSHRAIALHSLAASLPDELNISCNDTVLPVVSMYHANAWGLPYAATMNGSKLVLPGCNLQPEALLNLLENEGVTLTAAVPSVWLSVLNAFDCYPGRWKLPMGLRIVVGGSAAPESLFRRFDKLGAHVIHAWGMTETTPIATACNLSRICRNGWTTNATRNVLSRVSPHHSSSYAL